MIRVVILGCGFGGVEVASELRKRSDDIEITMVDRRTKFQYQAAHPEILSGAVTPDEISADLGSFARQMDSEFINTEVTGVDFGARTVKTRDSSITYDYLVLAVGGEQAFFGIPGAESHSYCINTLEGAIMTKQALDKASGKVVIAGAGLTGVEVAGEVAVSKPHLQVYLVEMMPRVLPAFPTTKIAAIVSTKLRAMGVKILTGRALKEVRDDELIIDGQYSLPYDILIWTVGLRPARVLEQLRAPKTKGWLKVDPYLRIEGMKEVFAVGDNAYFEHNGLRSGQNVEEAEWQGKTAAMNIIRTMNNAKLRLYHPKNTVQNPRAIISLGGGTAVIYYRGIVTSFCAYKLKKHIEHRYMKRFRVSG